MGRIEDRKKAKKEKNALIKLCQIQNKFLPDLFCMFKDTKDPRNQFYTTYSNRVMLGQMYFKGIAGLVSMQSMTAEFNNKQISKNLSRLMKDQKLKMLPHHVTENEYLERLEPEEIQKILNQIVCKMIRRKTFSDARYKKKWLIIVDATRTYSGKRVGLPDPL